MKKILAEIFLWKEKFLPKKNSIKTIFNKKKFVEKNFRKKNFSNKKIRKKLKNSKIFIFSIFLYLKKKLVEIRLIFEKKIEKNFENLVKNMFFNVNLAKKNNKK